MGKNKNKKNNAAKAANTNDPDAIKVFTLILLAFRSLIFSYCLQALGNESF